MHIGALKITANTLDITALTMINVHKEKIIFRQTFDVYKAPKNQDVAAINNLYLKKLHNFLTDTTTMTVDALLTHLFASYSLDYATAIKK